MTQPKNTFLLTKEDKLKYLDQIQNFDLSKRQYLLEIVPQKLNFILQDNSINSIQLQLINDLVKLYKLLEDNPNMDKMVQKKICFALDYFSVEEDEIPDSIPVYGLMDDAAVIHWIIEDLKGVIAKKVQS